MSVLFGPVVQQGYVVPDVELAMQHWLARGVGPFVFVDIKEFPGIWQLQAPHPKANIQSIQQNIFIGFYACDFCKHQHIKTLAHLIRQNRSV